WDVPDRPGDNQKAVLHTGDVADAKTAEVHEVPGRHRRRYAASVGSRLANGQYWHPALAKHRTAEGDVEAVVLHREPLDVDAILLARSSERFLEDLLRVQIGTEAGPDDPRGIRHTSVRGEREPVERVSRTLGLGLGETFQVVVVRFVL